MRSCVPPFYSVLLSSCAACSIWLYSELSRALYCLESLFFLYSFHLSSQKEPSYPPRSISNLGRNLQRDTTMLDCWREYFRVADIHRVVSFLQFQTCKSSFHRMFASSRASSSEELISGRTNRREQVCNGRRSKISKEETASRTQSARFRSMSGIKKWFGDR